MTLPTFTPPMRPSSGTAHSPEVALRKASFGDAYAQAAPAGLNHIRAVVTLRWDFLDLTEAQEIEGFLAARGGFRPFLYVLNGEAEPRRWVCDTWSMVAGHPSRVTATFRETFNPA